MVLCRAEENLSEACFETDGGTSTVFADTDDEKNDGLFRDGSTVLVVTLGDEGDPSRRIPNGSADIEPYLNTFGTFSLRYGTRFVSLGPNLVQDTDSNGYSLPCNSGGSTDWAAKRLLDMSAQSNGLYVYLEEKEDECQPNNFVGLWDQVIRLLE